MLGRPVEALHLDLARPQRRVAADEVLNRIATGCAFGAGDRGGGKERQKERDGGH
jgi:hypothetical protein